MTSRAPTATLPSADAALGDELRVRAGIGQLRIADVLVLLAASRCGTVTGAARELGTTPSQVCKAIARLERQLEVALLSRGTRGIHLRDDGMRLLPALERMVAAARSLDAGGAAGRTLTVAAPPYLGSYLLPRIAVGLPGVRLRGVDLAPQVLRTQLTSDAFEVCISVGSDRVPPSWSVTAVGVLGMGLFACPKLQAQLGEGPIALERVRDLPLIVPTNPADGQFGAEELPLGRGRARGHEASTFALALELAAVSEQLVYGPVLGARCYLDAGVLVRLDVAALRRNAPAYLGCRAAAVLATEQRAMVDVIRTALIECERS